jgi:hypothetical protein
MIKGGFDKDVAISVDPGMGGGIAWHDGNEMNWSKTPSGAKEMANSVRRIVRHFSIEGIPKRKILVTIEQVHAMPHDGRSSLFKFGTNYGMWLGIFGTMNLDVVPISPQVWQKSYISTPSAFESKAKRKRYLKNIAIECYQTGDKKITLATSDAVLICKYSYEELLLSSSDVASNNKGYNNG